LQGIVPATFLHDCTGKEVLDVFWSDVETASQVGWIRYYFVGCETAQGFDSAVSEFNNETGECRPSPKNDDCEPCIANPINVGTGAKLGAYDIGLGRASLFKYNSFAQATGTETAGTNWSWMGSATVVMRADGKAEVRRATGVRYRFALASGSWIGDADVNDRLVELKDANNVRTGWKYTDASTDSVEIFSATGRLLTITSRSGVVQTYVYNAAGQTTSVTDSFGRVTLFTYFPNTAATGAGNVASITDPLGNVVNFTYDSAKNLSTATLPGGAVKTFLYNEQAYTQNADRPNSMTGVVDENGARYATYAYGAKGLAISSEHAGGVEKFTMTNYGTGANHQSSFIDPFGVSHTFDLQFMNGVAKVNGIIGSCPMCNGSNSQFSPRDANGNVTSRTDFNWKKVCYAHELSRNLETARVEGLYWDDDCTAALATPPDRPDVRKTTTTWHATYRLPVTIMEPAAAASVGGTPGTKTTVFTHDANGNVLTKTVTAPKNDGTAGNESRVWTWTYNTLGQVLTAKDPLNRTTTTVYYAATDTAVPPKYTKGDVQTVTNAAAHVTTFNEYDKNGRLTKLTDPNGLITTMTYHPRGWLTSRAVNNGTTTETTNYTYDNVGQLTRVTLPDASTLYYAYDDAHRLVGMSDQVTGTTVAPNGSLRVQLANLSGNKIIYTLDNMGNRLSESNYDPAGVLQKYKSRAFDGLNHLGEETGGTTYATAPTQSTNVYFHDFNGNLTTFLDPIGGQITNAFDALNRKVESVVAPSDDGLAVTTTYIYDGAHNLTRVTDPEGKSTDYTYNGHNNLITQLSPDTGTTQFKYNAVGNVLAKIDAANRCSASTYDTLNRIKTVKYYAATNASTNTKALCFGTIAGTVVAEETITYNYDNTTATGGGAGGKGRLTSIVDNSGTTNYTYDKNGRVTIKKYTLSSNATQNGGATNLVKSVTYTYNTYGQLASTTTPSGQTIAYTYGSNASNAPGKVVGIKVNGIDVVKNGVYEPFGPNGGWSWGNHNGTTVINQHLRVFDLDFRPVAISSDPQGYNRNLTWDQANRITGITVPGTASGTATISIPGVSNALSVNQAFLYDGFDRLMTTTFGKAGAATAAAGRALLPTETFSYDGIGNRLSRSTIAPGATSTQSTAYSYAADKHWLANSTGQVPDTWAYDTTGNATYESNAGMWGGYGSSGTVTSAIYATSSTGKANKALVNTFDAKNRLSKVAIAAANTAQATAATSANTVTYRINALGQRVQKIGAGTFAQPTTIPFAVTLSNPPTQAQLQALNTQVTAFYANTRFIYDEQGRLLGEYSKDGKLVEETVWFDDLPVAVLKPKGASATSPVSGTGNVATNNQDANNTGTNGNTAPPAAPTAKVNVEVFYVHPDHLGTPRVITASSALAATTGTGITSPQTVNKAVWRWDSDPFGSNATANSAPNENPNTLSQVVGTATLPYLFGFDLAFPGQKRDRETGKHYNYFRDYDPSIGRYFESDPIGLWGGISTFGYVGARPVLDHDRRGLAAFSCSSYVPWMPLFPHAGLCVNEVCRGWGPASSSIGSAIGSITVGTPGSWEDETGRYKPDQCRRIDPPPSCDGAKLESCILELTTPRPDGWYQAGVNNCHTKKDDVIMICMSRACSASKTR
jgi:RHS repeat-associated protein